MKVSYIQIDRRYIVSVKEMMECTEVTYDVIIIGGGARDSVWMHNNQNRVIIMLEYRSNLTTIEEKDDGSFRL